MNCVNCGHENLEKALLCYWCGQDPRTGETPYPTLAVPVAGLESELAVPDVALPPTIEVPPPMPVADVDAFDLAMPDLPSIEIAPPPEIPDLDEFTKIQRQRVHHRPVVRRAPAPRMATRPLLPGRGRLLVFAAGLGLLYLLGTALVGAVGVASFGSVFCLGGLFILAVVLWIGLLFARIGRRAATLTGVAHERLELLGRVLREELPGVVKELPVNLPATMGVLDQPVAYSELRSLASPKGEPATEQAVDLLTGAVASLVGRDDVVLARRTYPVERHGALTQSSSTEVSQPVLTRRRSYVGPGQLESQIAQTLRTDRPMTVEELMRSLFEPGGREQAQRLVTFVEQALAERPPDLEALASPDEALAAFERYREAMRQADPELYKLLEAEIQRGLRAVAQRPVPSSLLDLARYTTPPERSRQSRRRSGTRRRR